ncbi:MAG: hypothetical protein ACQXXF_04855 [Thermoplasmatota archaeon]|jgi:hypothetical protein
MEKKTILLELSCELIDKIDRLNTLGDRSSFISSLLEEQINSKISKNIDNQDNLVSIMKQDSSLLKTSGEISLVTDDGLLIGKFDINTLEGFENLTRKIQEISKDPAVQIRASTLF